jgi:hypothetical protein
MKSLKRLTTMPNRFPLAERFPSITRGGMERLSFCYL